MAHIVLLVEIESTVTRERPGDASPGYVVVVDGSTTQVKPLPADEDIEIGREEDCYIQVRDESVSRRHACLRLPAFELEDLGSKNGTRVDGRSCEPGTPTQVGPGSLIEIGDVTLVLQRGPIPEARTHLDDEPGSDAMKRVLRAVRCVASDDITVLLLGETGVGKEVMAERVHSRSRRREAPFVRVHCAAISESLFESELFGHEKGAFTGATSAKAGLLESGEGGTVFIDEVGELPPNIQVKLLRVLEDRRVRRVGGRDEKQVDIRFVAATNRNLEEEVAAGRFRQDLYFRLSGFTIRIPPLRDRQDEILPLAKLFLAELCKHKGIPEPSIDDALAQALSGYSWPGNVRELKNVINRLVVMSEGGALSVDDLPRDEMERRAKLMLGAPTPSLDSNDERTRILAALEHSGGNQTEAAKLLGIARRTLIKRLEQYDIPRPRKK